MLQLALLFGGFHERTSCGKCTASGHHWLEQGTCLLPDFTFMQIYTYLTESRCKAFDSESIKTFKSLRPRNILQMNLYKTLPCTTCSRKYILYIRAHVSASMKDNVYITMDQQLGEVFGSKCTSVAG